MPLISNLSVHACPLASDSKAARVRRRVNIRAYARAIRVTHVRARVTSTRSARERVSITSIPRPLQPRKKVEGLGTRLACPLRVNLVHAFEPERVRFRLLACTRASTCVCVCEYSRATRARHARAVKLLVSGTVCYAEPTRGSMGWTGAYGLDGKPNLLTTLKCHLYTVRVEVEYYSVTYM